ncbi:hypothetical protein ABGB07_39885 [Micromonosporaceae bacterium B7E4]
MSTPTFPELGGCGRPARARIEFYSPGRTLHGFLDGSAHACPVHVEQMEAAGREAGFTTYTSVLTVETRCGAGWDYRTWRRIDAPEPDPNVVVADGQEHPAWCARLPDADGNHDWHQSGWHTSGWISTEHPREVVVAEAALTGSYSHTVGRWLYAVLVRFTDVDDNVEVREYSLALEQAEVFGALLVHLVDQARAGGR